MREDADRLGARELAAVTSVSDGVRARCCVSACVRHGPHGVPAAAERRLGGSDRALRQTEQGNNFLSIVCQAGFLLAALIYKFFSFNVLII